MTTTPIGGGYRREPPRTVKTAILQVADTGPLDSLVEMLQSVGYRCYICGPGLRDALKRLGCDTVLANADLVKNEGYEPPSFSLGEATILDMETCDLFVDVKAHRNYARLLKSDRWGGNLQGKVLWYRINGGKPEHVVNSRGDMGDEVDPPCPVLTPNQWYAKDYLLESEDEFVSSLSSQRIMELVEKSYACWPPFVGMADYDCPRPHTTGNLRARKRFAQPLCLVHNFQGWGYGPLLEVAREFGVRIHGLRSPDGLLSHAAVKVHLADALAYVHLKSSDAPGYSLYEALSAACPVVCTRRLIWKNRMEELLVPGETCYVFDRPTHGPICPEEVAEVRVELGAALKALSSVQENQRVGETGRRRLKELMWSKDRPEDVASLREFMVRNFGIME